MNEPRMAPRLTDVDRARLLAKTPTATFTPRPEREGGGRIESPPVSLVEFLLARIAEDEEAARRVYDEGKIEFTIPLDEGESFDVGALSPARVLAECEAKRRIVAGHPDYGGYGESCATCAESDSHIDLTPWPCPTLRALGFPYADHPDYRQEWKS